MKKIMPLFKAPPAWFGKWFTGWNRVPMREYEIESILSLVQKPARYTGGETNAVRKKDDQSLVSFALAFPDVYEVGMSHQGFQIFYGILNQQDRWRAERAYAPWPDMASLMRSRGMALTSLESETPLHRFDIVGFSLQYELSCTNVLFMLDLGKIPLRAAERREEHPIVIAGGPCVFNPEPMVPFFDAFALGEGEETIIEIMETIEAGKKAGLSRQGLLEGLAKLEGMYVPPVHGNNHPVRRRVITDLNCAFLPDHPVVPLIKTIHDRITLEIARGCTRGCRFCQAGMVWRPSRERNPELIADCAGRALTATGHDEISLLSLSAGDYSCIGPLLTELMNRNAENRVALALPSLRTETLTEALIEQIKRVRKTSFTLAPEAGTQRLRNVINKGNTEENLLTTAQRVFDAGWKSMKLYFMIGLPTERKEDLEGIVELVYKVLRAGGERRQVTASLSTFVPKPHTPFQWERQITLEETEERQRYFKDILRHRNLKLKWHDRRMSFLEGIISRGDRRIADVIERAYRLGANFDGWSDRFRFELWEQAIRETGIDPLPYLERRDLSSVLPWDYIDCGVTKDFLLREHERSRREEWTEDCRVSGCHNCGACGNGIEIRTASPAIASLPGSNIQDSPITEIRTTRSLRLRYKKTGKARFLSHLDTASALIRGIIRSGLRFEYSQGFHPYPKISFPAATALGIESEEEFADIQVYSPPDRDRKHLILAINDSLPSGLSIISLEYVSDSRQSLAKQIVGFVYEMYLDRQGPGVAKSAREVAVKKFLESKEYVIRRQREKKTEERDIRPFVESLVYDEEKGMLRGVFRLTERGGVKPHEILTQVMGLDENTAKNTKILKKQTIVMNG